MATNRDQPQQGEEIEPHLLGLQPSFAAALPVERAMEVYGLRKELQERVACVVRKRLYEGRADSYRTKELGKRASRLVRTRAHEGCARR